MREWLAKMIGPSRLLVVDEAQYRNQRNGKTSQLGEAFEWLRATADACGFDVVFCGDVDLPKAIARMPQLQSRLMRPVFVEEVSRADVAAVVEGTAFGDANSIEALHIIARRRGGLCNVENVTRIATLFAGEGRPNHSHLKAAIIDMKLGKRG